MQTIIVSCFQDVHTLEVVAIKGQTGKRWRVFGQLLTQNGALCVQKGEQRLLCFRKLSYFYIDKTMLIFKEQKLCSELLNGVAVRAQSRTRWLQRITEDSRLLVEVHKCHVENKEL